MSESRNDASKNLECVYYEHVYGSGIQEKRNRVSDIGFACSRCEEQGDYGHFSGGDGGGPSVV